MIKNQYPNFRGSYYVLKCSIISCPNISISHWSLLFPPALNIPPTSFSIMCSEPWRKSIIPVLIITKYFCGSLRCYKPHSEYFNKFYCKILGNFKSNSGRYFYGSLKQQLLHFLNSCFIHYIDSFEDKEIFSMFT